MTDNQAGDVKLIVVRIGSQVFGINMMSVREIRAWNEPIPQPQAPKFVRGVIQIRGTVLPVIDLGDRLGLGESVPAVTSVLVIAEIGTRLLSLLVDAVCDLAFLAPASLQLPINFHTDSEKPFVAATAMFNGQILSLLSLDNIIPERLFEAA